MSSTEICNTALSHLGSAKEIEDLETERSQEASACRRFYDSARQQLLKDYRWPFASAFVALSLVETDPNEEWKFSYRYPSNCLTIRRILSGNRRDANDTKVPYKIGRDASGFLIYTDKEEAEVEFTYNETETGRFSNPFKMALSFLIAYYIAPRITAGDPFKLGERALKNYLYESSKAMALAAEEEKPDENPDSEFIRVRES